MIWAQRSIRLNAKGNSSLQNIGFQNGLRVNPRPLLATLSVFLTTGYSQKGTPWVPGRVGYGLDGGYGFSLAHVLLLFPQIWASNDDFAKFMYYSPLASALAGVSGAHRPCYYYRSTIPLHPYFHYTAALLIYMPFLHTITLHNNICRRAWSGSPAGCSKIAWTRRY